MQDGKPGKLVTVSDEERAGFGRALGDSLSVRRVTQRELADRLGVKQPTVSAWISGDAEPAPEIVFRIEEALELGPGTLSRHLGYLPPAAVKTSAGVETAILDDPTLSIDAKNALLGAYRAVAGSGKTKRGRPKKGA